MKLCGVVLLILGILFLLGDLAVWNFWNIQWWTVAFLFGGLAALCTGGCPMCKEAKK
ncbi:hypothetical protein HQ533_06180 [Candidatus Woesearchaeota archaeon]|nr:hypothetical protein [Candidatus Woesearchaeota archaeon]